MSTDNGSPPKTVMKTFDITLRDMNDPPFNITLSATSVNESAPKNTLIGQFSSQDEDATQRLNYKLTNDDGGNFFVTNTGLLYKAKPPDYETTSDHTIEVEVSDNGIVQQKVLKHKSKTFICNPYFSGRREVEVGKYSFTNRSVKV